MRYLFSAAFAVIASGFNDELISWSLTKGSLSFIAMSIGTLAAAIALGVMLGQWAAIKAMAARMERDYDVNVSFTEDEVRGIIPDPAKIEADETEKSKPE